MSAWQFADVWEVVADALPEATALRHGARRISWRALSDRADGLARSLLEGGLERGSSLGLLLYSAPEYLEASFAAFKLGVPPVNTNYRYGPDELAYLWDNADAGAVVFHGSFAERVAEVRPRVPRVGTWLWVDDGSAPCPEWAVPYEEATTGGGIGGAGGVGGGGGGIRAPWGRSPDDLVLLYTGGTTGMPKGVMWRHDDLFAALNATAALRYPDEGGLDDVRGMVVVPGPSYLVAAPLMHGTGFFGALGVLGAAGSVITPVERSFSATAMLDTLSATGAKSTSIVGDVFCRPLVEALDAEPARWDLSALRVITSSGAVWSGECKQGLLRHQPSALLVDTLGSSEAVGAAKTVTRAGDGQRPEPSGDGSGRTTPSFTLGPTTRVLDADGHDVAPGSGQVGIVAQRGRGPIGYYKDPAASARTFRTIDGVRWTITGDEAQVNADGTVRLLGRGSACINTGGEKVYPEEVETVLKSHPGVVDVACVGVPDDRLGQRVTAVVEARVPGAPPQPEELIGLVKANLAGYKAPKAVVFVGSVGRAANGKLDYATLRQVAIDAG